MLLKKSAFGPGLRFFFPLSLFSVFFFCRRRERGLALRDPTDTSFPMDPNGGFISLMRPKPPRGLGVNGVERPNEFLSSRLLLEPSITAAWSGEPAPDVFVRVMV